MPCRSTTKLLDRRGVEYTYHDVTASPEALDTVTSLGYSGVPVIVVDGDTHWQGYNPDRLETIL